VTQPTQPTVGPGSDGSCAVKQTQFNNHPATYKDASGKDVGIGPDPVCVFEPQGNAAAKIGDGRCGDAKRPTVFIATGAPLGTRAESGDRHTACSKPLDGRLVHRCRSEGQQ
jgi:hypothetical protein